MHVGQMTHGRADYKRLAFCFIFLHSSLFFLSLLLDFLWTSGFFIPMQGDEDVFGDADPNLTFDLDKLGLEAQEIRQARLQEV